MRDPRTFKLVYTPDPSEKRYLALFARGYRYTSSGLFPTDRHLLGRHQRPARRTALFLLGTDLLGPGRLVAAAAGDAAPR